MPDETNLSLETTDDLVHELLHRFDYAAFIGMTTRTNMPDGEAMFSTIRRWVGNSHTCMGLVADLQNRILSELDARAFGDGDEK